ncbi:MAG: PIN domain-containing protein [Syntrophales bacterium LBB04]|nr:PIN domain-containing protein [Syntrophales bacterium LBB04]
MRRYLIDTNALISFVTDRNLEQQQKIAPLFELAAHMKAVIFCPQHVLTEFVYVLDRIYQVPKDEIGRMIKDLIEMPGIEVLQEVDLNTTLSWWPDPIPDFGDALIAAAGKTRSGSMVVTVDRKFAANLKALGINIHMFEK